MEKKHQQKRRNLFIYKPVQLLILKVIVASCTLSVCAILSASAFFYIFIVNQYFMQESEELLQVIDLLSDFKFIYLAYVFTALLIAIGLIIFSWLKLSHKIAGPLYRMRTNLKDYVELGKEFQAISLRKDDEMKDLAELINAAVLKSSRSSLK